MRTDGTRTSAASGINSLGNHPARARRDAAMVSCIILHGFIAVVSPASLAVAGCRVQAFDGLLIFLRRLSMHIFLVIINEHVHSRALSMLVKTQFAVPSDISPPRTPSQIPMIDYD